MNKARALSVNQTKAIKLALTGGFLVIINAVLLGIVGKWFIGIMPVIPGSSGNDPTLFIELAIVGLVFGVLILISALLLRSKPAKKRVGGIMLIGFSIPTVIMGGGFIVGFILGIIGGTMMLSRKG
jgi:hypothetical protein